MDFLVVDFEFSVPRSYGKPRAWFPEIIEVGAIVLDPNGKLLVDKTFNAFVKPRFWPRLAEESYGITGIRQEDVDQGIPLEEAIRHLQKLVLHQETTIVAWGDADRKILGSVCEKYGLKYPFIWDNYIDLAEQYKHYRSLDHLISLKRAIEENAIEQIGILHSALDDAINAAQVMAKIMSEGWAVKTSEQTHGFEEKRIADAAPRNNSNIIV
ncbi:MULTISPECIES: 3'-5' exonuclease KapD [Desulfitobacterium]|uniref:Inhibitor of the KinA pathway to sporulation, predicted exonuclease n=1 Tax=Desulfitobacterium dehalogenans (strain ATCC 51507 / DSM 9161 / JW/IU-DC1) TaxID=756499 RepID=I4A9V1_DESDJ|nr:MULTISPECIES: 3'-5' exonuclease KapD [Desulfitobacterium]AFM00736.1 inhibitor of the KinA pathway to sporulation, predicted exonuclease [Desulfitobacterium dehalogenans ATCC 51507]